MSDQSTNESPAPAASRDILRDHEYDGIREYDNPTPGWWSMIFVATFLFSIWYFLFYHMSTISTSVGAGYDQAVSADMKRRFAEIGELKPNAETILKLMKDANWVQVGATVFKTQCVSCHGANGQGQIGPNLTDDYYKNVRQIADIARVISEGAANGAMPVWKNRLQPNEVVLVASYVASLRGKNLQGRAPEGEAIAPWSETPATSAKTSTAAM